jgi:hypothetical protein
MQKRRFQKALDLFFKHLPEYPGKVLDIEYGHGEYTKEFEAKGYEVVVLDPQRYSLQDPQKEEREVIFSELEEVSLPYRTMSGIWIKDKLISKSKDAIIEYLSQFVDWLEVEGVMHFCLPEGEGYKLVEEHLPTGIHKTKQYFYSPVEVEKVIQLAGAQTVDAWYEQQGGKNWIHVIAKRV